MDEWCRNPFVNQVSFFKWAEGRLARHLASQSLRKSGQFLCVEQVQADGSVRKMSQSLRKSGQFLLAGIE